MRRTLARAALLTIGLTGPSAVPAFAQQPLPMVRDHYATAEDCAAEWGRARCDQLLSSGYSGGAVVHRSPPYPEGYREIVRRQAGRGAAGADGRAADEGAGSGRAIATVREPATGGEVPATRRGVPSDTEPDDAPADIAGTLAGLPFFAAFYGIALMLLTLALAVHVAITPIREIRLIRDGNAAIAASMAGMLLGLALPLARVLQTSETMLDLLAWGGVALLAQVLTVAAVRLAMAPMTAGMREGQVASGVLLGALAAALGLLNAAVIDIAFR